MASKTILGLTAATLAAALFSGTPARATPLFKITEAYAGVSGNDGTTDWFELTNFGDMAGNIGSYYYDDDSADPSVDYVLPNFDVEPGESVIVLIEGLDDPLTPEVDEEAENIATFYSFWGLPSSVQVGATDGGSLGGGGDAVNVFDGNLVLSGLVDSLTYASTDAGLTGTMEDVTGMGPIAESQVGVNGAFTSVGTTGIGPLVGSPGRISGVPEPASMVLMVLGAVGLTLVRRR